jgi:hypothetical protein
MAGRRNEMAPSCRLVGGVMAFAATFGRRLILIGRAAFGSAAAFVVGGFAGRVPQRRPAPRLTVQRGHHSST